MRAGRNVAIGLAVVTALTAVRIAFYSPTIPPSDAGDYTLCAYRLAHGDVADAGPKSGFRPGMVVPLAILGRLGGYGPVSLGLYPLLCATGTLIVLLLLANRLAGPGIAVLAVTLVGTAPLLVRLATELLPETPMMFFALLAVWFGHGAAAAAQDSSVPGVRSRLHRDAMLCGMALYLAFAAKESVLFLLAPLAMSLAVHLTIGGRWRATLALASRERLAVSLLVLGFAIPLAVELLTLSHVFGTPLARLHWIAAGGATMRQLHGLTLAGRIRALRETILTGQTQCSLCLLYTSPSPRDS